MALDMMLELEGEHPDWDAVKEAAVRTGVTKLEFDCKKMGANILFSKSAVFVWLAREHPLRLIVAEGKHGCKFLTKYTLVMRINNSRYDESVSDIYTFLKHLSELSKMQFVLSFQYEGVRAIRDENGFEFFWHDSR